MSVQKFVSFRKIKKPLNSKDMKKTRLLLSVLLIPAIVALIAFSTGSPGGKTGSPGDGGANCTECHTGTPNPVDGWINSSIPPEGYVPGQQYTVTAIGNHAGVVRFGFELTAEDDAGTKVGTFTISDPLQTQYTNSQAAITHTVDGITPAGNMKVWNMNWMAPATNVGDITFYAAFNAADGSSGTTGDVIYLSTLTVSPTAPPSLISIEPDSAKQGSNILTTVIGVSTSWQTTSPAVSLSFHTNPSEVIDATEVTALSNTEIEVEFDIPSNASLGLWDLNVDALILEESFTVTEATPVLVDMDPEIGRQLDTIRGRLTGEFTNFTAGVNSMTLTNHDNPTEEIVGTNITILNDLVCQAEFIIPHDATVGYWDAHVDALSLQKAIYIDWTVGIAEMMNQEFSVYPNPSTGLVNIEVGDRSEVYIFSANGQEVFNAVEEGLVKVDLTNYGKGLYFVKLINAENTRVSKIIIR